MKNDRKAVRAIATQTAGEKKLPAVQYDVRNWSFIVMFDPQTGLPSAYERATATRSRATRTTTWCSPTGARWAE